MCAILAGYVLLEVTVTDPVRHPTFATYVESIVPGQHGYVAVLVSWTRICITAGQSVIRVPYDSPRNRRVPGLLCTIVCTLHPV